MKICYETHTNQDYLLKIDFVANLPITLTKLQLSKYCKMSLFHPESYTSYSFSRKYSEKSKRKHSCSARGNERQKSVSGALEIFFRNETRNRDRDGDNFNLSQRELSDHFRSRQCTSVGQFKVSFVCADSCKHHPRILTEKRK